MRKGLPSGFRSVYWDKAAWVAQIRMGERVIYLGHFVSEREAAAAYDFAALAHHGDFAQTNQSLGLLGVTP